MFVYMSHTARKLKAQADEVEWQQSFNSTYYSTIDPDRVSIKHMTLGLVHLIGKLKKAALFVLIHHLPDHYSFYLNYLADSCICCSVQIK